MELEKTKKLNDLAKSLYDHKLAVSMDEAVKMAENMLEGGKGEGISAGVVRDQIDVTAAAGASKKIKVEVKEAPLPAKESGLAPEDIKEELVIEKEIQEIESPQEEAQDKAIVDEMNAVKEEIAEATQLDQENVEATEAIKEGVEESQQEIDNLDKDFDILKNISKDVEDVQVKEWEASKVDEWAEKKLPGQELLKDKKKIYEEEAREEE